MDRKLLFNQLTQEFNLSVEQIIQQMKAFPWENQAAYSGWCAQTFYMVQHTTRYLCATASRFTVLEQPFHDFCLNHLREETGHELLAKYDLESFDKTLKDFPPTPETELMIQSQYYWIQKTPYSHFGFFWVLEKLSVEYGPEIINRVKKTHGPDCLQFLNLHVQEDVGHVSEIEHKVDKIPTEHLPALIKNIQQTGNLYSEMLRSLETTYVSNNVSKNASHSKKKAA